MSSITQANPETSPERRRDEPRVGEGHYPILTMDEMTPYFRLIRGDEVIIPVVGKKNGRAFEGVLTAAEARHLLILHNQAYAISIAMNYVATGVPFEDLKQCALTGLTIAVDHFDVELGYAFTTYATWKIMAEIKRGLRQSRRIIRFPNVADQAAGKTRALEGYLCQELQRSVSLGELATYAEVDPIEAQRARSLGAVASLDQPLSSHGPGSDAAEGLSLHDVAPDSSQLSQEWLADQTAVVIQTKTALKAHLTDLEYNIFVRMNGLFGYEKASRDDLAKMYSIKPDHVIDLIVKARAKLQHPSCDGLPIAAAKETWQKRAICYGLLELFFPKRGELVDSAKELCQTCPVQEQCKERGMGTKYGIWGGLSERERRSERSRRLNDGTATD